MRTHSTINIFAPARPDARITATRPSISWSKSNRRQRKKKRIAMLQQAGKYIMDEALFIPLYNLADIYGMAKNLDWKTGRMKDDGAGHEDQVNLHIVLDAGMRNESHRRQITRMRRKNFGRRDFLKRGALAGLSAAFGGSL